MKVKIWLVSVVETGDVNIVRPIGIASNVWTIAKATGGFAQDIRRLMNEHSSFVIGRGMSSFYAVEAFKLDDVVDHDKPKTT